MKEIVIASRNKGKIKEFKQIFEATDVQILSLDDFKGETFPEVEETGSTFFENAKLKAEAFVKIVNKPVIADDSGLVIEALDGRPGVYSARYAGIDATDEENYEKALLELQSVQPNERSARFIAVLALARPGFETIYFEGSCEGTIAMEPHGENGFGYDPIFIPSRYDKTMAQLTSEEKNRISHRFHALQQLKQWLEINPLT